MKRSKIRYDIGKLFKENWKWINQHSGMNTHQKRMLHAVSVCRTSVLGYHLDSCSSCDFVQISYNSCRNRHCPKCQSIQREQWIMQREEELLPVPYFHVVFTMPDVLNTLCLYQPKMLYDLLFKCAWQTIKTFAADPKHLGAKTGMTAILHTWGQTMTLHPHLHCIVPGGGLTSDGKWKTARSKGKFLFPAKAMSLVFRAKFVAELRKQAAAKNIKVESSIYKKLFAKQWVVYAKRPFASPKTVVEYLGRYTHKIAISNSRITNIDATTVEFRYKDYRQQSSTNNCLHVKTMQLDIKEFVRRFAMHVLPLRFQRIRHFGILASRNKAATLEAARASLGVQHPPCIQPIDWKTIARKRLGFDPEVCPTCQAKTFVRVYSSVSKRQRIRAPPIQPSTVCFTP